MTETGEVKLTLLPTTELLNLLLLVHNLRVERHRDADSCVAFNTARPFIIRVITTLATPVGLALDNKPTVACRYQLLKDGRELARHLLEGTLDSLVLLLVQVLDERLD
jgi:hypothetical protein